MPAQGKHAKADSTKSRWLPWLLVALVACAVIVAQTLSVITREMPLETRVQFGTVDVKAVITTKNAAGEEVEASNGDELGKGGCPYKPHRAHGEHGRSSRLRTYENRLRMR